MSAIEEGRGRILRRLYTGLLYLLLPLALLRLYWRGRQDAGHRRRWRERLGIIPPLPESSCLWIHAVSVGETRAALPLIRALLNRYPDLPLLVTTTTLTGSRQVREALGERVHHVYAPYDLPGAVARFLRNARPRLAIIMETELWPNLLRQCAVAGIPTLIANARLIGTLGARLCADSLADRVHAARHHPDRGSGRGRCSAISRAGRTTGGSYR